MFLDFGVPYPAFGYSSFKVHPPLLARASSSCQSKNKSKKNLKNKSLDFFLELNRINVLKHELEARASLSLHNGTNHKP